MRRADSSQARGEDTQFHSTIVLGSNKFCFLMLAIMFVAKRDIILALGNDGFFETFKTNYEARFKLLSRIQYVIHSPLNKA